MNYTPSYDAILVHASETLVFLHPKMKLSATVLKGTPGYIEPLEDKDHTPNELLASFLAGACNGFHGDGYYEGDDEPFRLPVIWTTALIAQVNEKGDKKPCTFETQRDWKETEVPCNKLEIR